MQYICFMSHAITVSYSHLQPIFSFRFTWPACLRTVGRNDKRRIHIQRGHTNLKSPSWAEGSNRGTPCCQWRWWPSCHYKANVGDKHKALKRGQSDFMVCWADWTCVPSIIYSEKSQRRAPVAVHRFANKKVMYEIMTPYRNKSEYIIIWRRSS